LRSRFWTVSLMTTQKIHLSNILGHFCITRSWTWGWILSLVSDGPEQGRLGLLTHNILAISQVNNKIYNDRIGVEALEASSERQN
jgi:hypothetical protein